VTTRPNKWQFLIAGAAIPFTLLCVFFCLLWLKDLHDDRKAFHHSQGVYSGFRWGRQQWLLWEEAHGHKRGHDTAGAAGSLSEKTAFPVRKVKTGQRGECLRR
jgi:hypothetical protein